MIFNERRRFIRFRNVSGVVLAKGTPVVLDHLTLDGDGVKLASAGKLGLFAGIAYGPKGTPGGGSILNGAWGIFQVGGLCDYALVANHAATQTEIGDVLLPVAAQAYCQRSAAGDGRPAFITAAEVIAANAVITSAVRKVWLGYGE